MESVVLTLASLAVGVLATWFFAKRYYVQASKDLVEETERLRKMVNFLGLALEKEGYITLTWKDDNIAGITLHVSGTSTGTSHASANATITKRTPEN